MAHCSLLPNMQDPVFEGVHHEEFLELSSWLNDSLPVNTFVDTMPDPTKAETQTTTAFQPLPTPVSPSSSSSALCPTVAELVTIPLPEMAATVTATAAEMPVPIKQEPIARVSPAHSVNYDSDNSNKPTTSEISSISASSQHNASPDVPSTTTTASNQGSLKRSIDDVEASPADRTTKQKKQRR